MITYNVVQNSKPLFADSDNIVHINDSKQAIESFKSLTLPLQLSVVITNENTTYVLDSMGKKFIVDSVFLVGYNGGGPRDLQKALQNIPGMTDNVDFIKQHNTDERNGDLNSYPKRNYTMEITIA